MYNDLHIQALQEALEVMKVKGEVFNEYCTHKCEYCPLTDMCDWEGCITYTDERMTEEVLDAFVEYHDKVQTAEERKTFREVTGIDPAWYDFNEDRYEG